MKTKLTKSEQAENNRRRQEGYEPKAFYRNGQRVTIRNLGYDKEFSGTVCGKSLNHVWDMYIVRLDDPSVFPGNEWECIVLPEGCLSPQ